MPGGHQAQDAHLARDAQRISYVLIVYGLAFNQSLFSPYSADEAALLRAWAEGGHGLMLLGDWGPFRRETQELFLAFGYSQEGDQAVSDPTNVNPAQPSNIWVIFGADNFAAHPILEGAASLELQASSWLSPSLNAIVTTDADALPPGVAVMAAFAQGAGCVTLAGDSNWVATDDGSGMRGAYSREDNARVGRQMVRWLDLCSSLSLTKSAAPSPVLAGEVLTYTLTAVNRDDSPLTNVVVTDALPAEVSFVDASPPYTGPDAGGVITWSLGALDVDASAGLTMAVRVDGALLTGTLITNQAWVTSDEGPGDTATTITPVSQQIADPLVVKTADPGRARPGQVVTWSIPVLAPADMATMTLRTRVTRDAGPLPPALSNQATLNFDQGTDRVSNRVEVLLPSPAPPTPTPKPRQEKDPTPTPVPPTPIPTPIPSPTVEAPPVLYLPETGIR